jgi:hypothetical protein
MASATPCVTRSTASRRSGVTRASASPNSTANRITGSIAPSAAAFTTFCATRSMNHCASAGVPGGGTAPVEVAGVGPRSTVAAF